MIFWQYKITKYFAAENPPWVLFRLIILSIIIIRSYFQLNNDFYTKEVSCLANSALENAIYWYFFIEISKLKISYTCFQTQITWYIRVKHGIDGANPLLWPQAAHPELWSAFLDLDEIIWSFLNQPMAPFTWQKSCCEPSAEKIIKIRVYW